MLSTLKALCEWNPLVNGGFPYHKGPVVWICDVSREQAVEQTIELTVIWDGMTLMWRHCNGWEWSVKDMMKLHEIFPALHLYIYFTPPKFCSCFICCERNIKIWHNLIVTWVQSTEILDIDRTLSLIFIMELKKFLTPLVLIFVKSKLKLYIEPWAHLEDVEKGVVFMWFLLCFLEERLLYKSMLKPSVDPFFFNSAVDCRDNTIQFFMVLHTALRWQWQNVDETSNSQQTPHTSPSRASYGVSVVRILEKIERIITAPHVL